MAAPMRDAATALLLLPWLASSWLAARADCGGMDCGRAEDEVSMALPIIGLLLGCAFSLGFCHLAIRLWMRRRETAFLRSTVGSALRPTPLPPRLRDSDPVLSGALPTSAAEPPRYETLRT